ncbi:MAG: hypothetical protein IT380_14160 [Myxococcales bacterium]|nr:hypothetical protein [Myxococcales bacterium]
MDVRRATRLRAVMLGLALGLALASCGGEEPCTKVSCSPGRVCVPETGVCQAADAGT